MKTVEIVSKDLLKQRLALIFEWYKKMIVPGTGRFQYLYLPQTDRFVHEQCPIRDLGTVWDVEVLSSFLDCDDLRKPIEISLRHYKACLIERDGCLILDPRRLQEPSSIAHSAIMILSLLNAPSPESRSQIAALADGILRQQRRDGSYKVYFDELPDEGEELYAGEAMLALIEYYRHSSDLRALSSVGKGLAFYSQDYFRAGRVSNDLLVFFANWQSQAARLFAESALDKTHCLETADYMFEMHDQIIGHGFYRDIERHPDRQVSVAVACALEGLNDTYTIARTMHDERATEYRECICVGLDYLVQLQCAEGGTERERGGFGVSLDERAQRIDITGHAASALMKSIQNEIVD
ncbi:MAG: hypothetical protein ACXWKG_09705 [Limisphaerales bacterium]